MNLRWGALISIKLLIIGSKVVIYYRNSHWSCKEHFASGSPLMVMLGTLCIWFTPDGHVRNTLHLVHP